MNVALLGYPLGHSASPAMQNAALAAAGLEDWHYHLLAVPRERLDEAVETLRAPDYAGANVTVPHKQAVLPLLDGVTPVAHAIGAVNTVVKHDGRLIGHNTDAAGLLADLYVFGVKVERRPVLVLGAGGAARTAVAALSGVGARLRVAARRPAQAEAMRSLAQVEICEWTPLGLLQATADCALIVNATPVGMSPNTEASPWLPEVPFPPEAFLYDLIYNPPETLLVRQARAAGLSAATGLGMLVEQGALAFELWTGKTAPRSLMRQAAEASLFRLVRSPN